MSTSNQPVCYLCQREITPEIETKEHIIPDSIGGKLKGKGILCLPCNNGPASAIDKEIGGMLSYLYTLVQAAQDSPPDDMILTGRDVEGNLFSFYGRDLKPQVTVTLKIGEREFLFRDQEAEALNKVKKRITQFSAKYNALKSVDLSRDLKLTPKSHPVLYFNDSTGKTRSGGVAFFRSALKIAVNFYIKSGGDSKEIEIAKRLVREGGDDVMWKARFYYPELPIHAIAADEISHLLHLVGDPEKKVLYCYIELFNCHNVLVLLSDNYKGAPIKETYCYDLVKKIAIIKTINLRFNSRGSIVDYFASNIDTRQKRQEKFDETEKKIVALLMKKGFAVGSIGKEPTA